MKKTIVIKPTNKCNFSCTYCYAASERLNSNNLSIEKARLIANWIFLYSKITNAESIELIWHGGEPLLVGIDFYSEILSYIDFLGKRERIITEHSIQSNLSLINDKFINILKKYFNSSIGFSLDYNTGERKFNNGKDAQNFLVEKYKSIKEKGINISAITIITPKNISDISGLYNFFKKIGCDFKCHRVFPPTIKIRQLEKLYTDDFCYLNALIELFDLWFYDNNPTVEIINFVDIATSLISGNPVTCSQGSDCQNNFLAISPDGTISPCGRFGVSEAYGNVFIDSPHTIIDNISKKSLDKHYRFQKCDSCRFSVLCNGGCLHDRYTGNFEHYCYENLGIFNHIEKRLKEKGIGIAF